MRKFLFLAFSKTHAPIGRGFYGHPAYDDFKLRTRGLVYVYPDHSEGMIYDDGTSFMGYTAWKVTDIDTGKAEFNEGNAQRTINDIARFSKRDADTAYNLLEKYRKKWRAAFHEWRYNAPTPWGVPDAFERLINDPEAPIPPEYQFYTSQQVAYDLFESDYLRTLFMRSCMTSSGVFPNDCIGVYKILHTLGLILSWEPASIAVGGTHAITHALQRAFSSMGGEFVVETAVSSAIIQDGKAVGVRLKDGREIATRHLVVSDLNTTQTVLQLIGEEHVPSKIAHRAKNILRDRAQLFWGNFALHELPQVHSSERQSRDRDVPAPQLGAEGPRLFRHSTSGRALRQRYPRQAGCHCGSRQHLGLDSRSQRKTHHSCGAVHRAVPFLQRQGLAQDEEGDRGDRPGAMVVVRSQHDQGQRHRGAHHDPNGRTNAKRQYAPGRLDRRGYDSVPNGENAAIPRARLLPSSGKKHVPCFRCGSFRTGNREGQCL